MATIGETLRAARERRGLSLSEASRLTRIAPRFLIALEEDDYAALPAPVYARGFLRSYAALLGLDPEPLVAALRAHMERPPDVVGYEESEQFAAGPTQERAGSTRWRAAPPSSEEPTLAWGADVLRERPGGGTGRLWVALVLGAIILAVALFALALSLCGSDAERQAPPAAALPTATPGATIIAVVPGTTGADATPSGGGSSATEELGGTPAGTTGPSSASSPTTAAPTTPSGSQTVAPTPTSRPPTATPTSTPTATPTPTPTPPPPPGVSGFAECPREGASVRCPQQEEYRVVCYPGGWFLDLDPYYPVPEAPGWRVVFLHDWRDAVGRDPCAP
ncbi:hypothetical protein HRbin29_00028 [bacterium HR29]|jgi:cytoskeleton protein RodZ|nr:hypothetical protein HRbin29_00028 [bacterium HR29]